MMWLFALGWLAGVVSTLLFGRWITYKLEKQNDEGEH